MPKNPVVTLISGHLINVGLQNIRCGCLYRSTELQLKVSGH